MDSHMSLNPYSCTSYDTYLCHPGQVINLFVSQVPHPQMEIVRLVMQITKLRHVKYSASDRHAESAQ
jgi:hypothetical protein